MTFAIFKLFFIFLVVENITYCTFDPLESRLGCWIFLHKGDVRFHHILHKRIKANLGFPFQQSFCLRRISLQLLHLSRPVELGVHPDPDHPRPLLPPNLCVPLALPLYFQPNKLKSRLNKFPENINYNFSEFSTL